MQNDGPCETQAKTLPDDKKRRLLRRIRNAVSSRPEKTLAAKKVLVEHVGIDNIKHLLTELWAGIKDYIEAGKPDSPGGTKRTSGEMILLALKRIPGLTAIVFKIKELGLEFADLDETERKEVITYFAEKCELPNEKAELIAEVLFAAVLNVTYTITDTYEAIKEILKDDEPAESQ